jgi:selenide,water dikinase
MGGEPLFALNVVGFPTAKLPLEVLAEILAGGAKTTAEAGIPILGGHTTDFDVPVYGMVVNGRAKASRIRRNVGARPGDLLVLTKPIGSGILSSALRSRALGGFFRRGPEISGGEEAAAVETMARLNRSAARAAGPFPVAASTDVTGYGLLGHLREMAEGSGVDAEISLPAVPLLAGARRLVEAGIAPDGSHRNLAAARPFLDAPGLREADLLLLADAQTSGGLLLAVPERDAEALAAAIREGGDAVAAVVGAFRAAGEGRPGRISVRP